MSSPQLLAKKSVEPRIADAHQKNRLKITCHFEFPPAAPLNNRWNLKLPMLTKKIA